jgi:hypothetical protein
MYSNQDDDLGYLRALFPPRSAAIEAWLDTVPDYHALNDHHYARHIDPYPQMQPQQRIETPPLAPGATKSHATMQQATSSYGIASKSLTGRTCRNVVYP